MPKLIDTQGALLADDWQVFNGDAGAIVAGANVLMPLDIWREYRYRWLEHGGLKGVLLMPGDDVSLLAQDLSALNQVAIMFPVFTDGRGYSQARLLRERHSFRGQVRAVGEVLVDQLFYLRRCGFDRFALRDDQDLAAARRALIGFSHVYQAGVNEAPLFRRRAGDAPQAAIGHAGVLGTFGVRAQDPLAPNLPVAA